MAVITRAVHMLCAARDVARGLAAQISRNLSGPTRGDNDGRQRCIRSMRSITAGAARNIQPGHTLEAAGRHLYSAPPRRLLSNVQNAVRGVLANPETVSVIVDGHRVRLRGTVSAGDLARVLDAIRRVPGVWVIQSGLQVQSAETANPRAMPSR